MSEYLTPEEMAELGRPVGLPPSPFRDQGAAWHARGWDVSKPHPCPLCGIDIVYPHPHLCGIPVRVVQ